MSNVEIDSGISPELLTTAREAGVKCLRAYRELVEAAMKPAEDPMQDYRPLLRSLFATLINGWPPISRCWPKLRLDDATTTYHDQAGIDWRTVTPPDIWLLARNVFWKIAWFTPFRGPASSAWHTWKELDPALDGFWGEWEPHVPENRPPTWGLIKETIAKCPQPDSWDDASIAIGEAPAGSNQDLLNLPDVVRERRNPMPYVVPEKPLPCDMGDLEKLLHEADELLSYYSHQRLDCSFLVTCFEGSLTRMLGPGMVVQAEWQSNKRSRGASDEGGYQSPRRAFPWVLDSPPVLEVTDYMVPIHLAECRYLFSLLNQELQYRLMSYRKRKADTAAGFWWWCREKLFGPNGFFNKKEASEFAGVYDRLKSANDFVFRHYKSLREEIESQ